MEYLHPSIGPAEGTFLIAFSRLGDIDRLILRTYILEVHERVERR